MMVDGPHGGLKGYEVWAEGLKRSAGRDFDAILRTYRLMARAREAERLRANLKRGRCPVHPGPEPSARARSRRGLDRERGLGDRRPEALRRSRTRRARRATAQVVEVHIRPEGDMDRVVRG